MSWGLPESPQHKVVYFQFKGQLHDYNICIHLPQSNIKPHSQVVVLEGRHFQDFAAGDSGIVIRADAESQTCQVQPWSWGPDEIG